MACLQRALCEGKPIRLPLFQLWLWAQQRCPLLMFKGDFAPTTALVGAIPTLASAGCVTSNLFISLKAQAILISLAGVEHIAVWMRRRQDCPLTVDCTTLQIGF